MATEKKKAYGNMRIISLDGSNIYRAETLTAFKNGKLNKDAFIGISGEPRNTVATKQNMPTARYCSRKAIEKKQERGSSVPPRTILGHRRELGYCFTISTRTTKPEKSI